MRINYTTCIISDNQMEGPASDPGINVRALSELFSIAAEEGGQGGQGCQICVSMMEIYQESVHDLLR